MVWCVYVVCECGVVCGLRGVCMVWCVWCGVCVVSSFLELFIFVVEFCAAVVFSLIFSSLVLLSVNWFVFLCCWSFKDIIFFLITSISFLSSVSVFLVLVFKVFISV